MQALLTRTRRGDSTQQKDRPLLQGRAEDAVPAGDQQAAAGASLAAVVTTAAAATAVPEQPCTLDETAGLLPHARACGSDSGSRGGGSGTVSCQTPLRDAPMRSGLVRLLSPARGGKEAIRAAAAGASAGSTGPQQAGTSASTAAAAAAGGAGYSAPVGPLQRGRPATGLFSCLYPPRDGVPRKPPAALAWLRRGTGNSSAIPTTTEGRVALGPQVPRRRSVFGAKRDPYAIHSAAWRGDVEEVSRLLATGATPDKTDKGGMRALGLAAWQGHLEAMRILLDAGAAANGTDLHGLTALHYAALQNRLEAAELLLSRGATVDARPKGPSWPTTPLAYAARMGHSDMARMLMAAGASPLGARRGADGALHEAAAAGHVEVVEVLLAGGVSHDAAGNKRGFRALHLAAQNGHAAVVRALLQRGAWASAIAKDGSTPLHLAAAGGYSDVALLLLAAGADLEARDKDGLTPLHMAMDQGRLHTVATLLAAGAEVAAAARDGRRAADRAHDPGLSGVLRAAASYGAGPAAPEGWGPPPARGPPLAGVVWQGQPQSSRFEGQRQTRQQQQQAVPPVQQQQQQQQLAPVPIVHAAVASRTTRRSESAAAADTPALPLVAETVAPQTATSAAGAVPVQPGGTGPIDSPMAAPVHESDVIDALSEEGDLRRDLERLYSLGLAERHPSWTLPSAPEGGGVSPPSSSPDRRPSGHAGGNGGIGDASPVPRGARSLRTRFGGAAAAATAAASASTQQEGQSGSGAPSVAVSAAARPSLVADEALLSHIRRALCSSAGSFDPSASASTRASGGTKGSGMRVSGSGSGGSAADTRDDCTSYGSALDSFFREPASARDESSSGQQPPPVLSSGSVAALPPAAAAASSPAVGPLPAAAPASAPSPRGPASPPPTVALPRTPRSSGVRGKAVRVPVTPFGDGGGNDAVAPHDSSGHSQTWR